MKNLTTNLPIFISIIIFLSGCGPSLSESEKLDIAKVTCVYMAETRNIDGTVRLKEINSARKQLGEELYTGTDDGIKISYEYGLCEELVLNDPEYNIKLLEAIDLMAEKARKEEEEKKLAKQRQEEAERLAKEQQERERQRVYTENMNLFKKSVNEIIEEYVEYNPPQLTSLIMRAYTYRSDAVYRGVWPRVRCNMMKGLNIGIEIAFKNFEDTVSYSMYDGCDYSAGGLSYLQKNSNHDFFGENFDNLLYSNTAFENIKDIHVYWTGEIYYDEFIKEIRENNSLTALQVKTIASKLNYRNYESIESSRIDNPELRFLVYPNDNSYERRINPGDQNITTKLSFNKSEINWFFKQGSSSITAEVFMTTTGGIRKNCEYVTLVPVSSYANERVQNGYLSNTEGINFIYGPKYSGSGYYFDSVEMSSKIERSIDPADEEYLEYFLTSECKNSISIFEDVPAGEYYLLSRFVWDDGIVYQGGDIMKKIKVLEGESKNIIISK
jgi:hypothetical protein